MGLPYPREQRQLALSPLAQLHGLPNVLPQHVFPTHRVHYKGELGRIPKTSALQSTKVLTGHYKSAIISALGITEVKRMSLVELMQELQGGDSQERFARRIGVTQRLISAIYSGERRPGGKVAGGLVRAYPERAEEIKACFFASK
jgi:hypothetical protein